MVLTLSHMKIHRDCTYLLRGYLLRCYLLRGDLLRGYLLRGYLLSEKKTAGLSRSELIILSRRGVYNF